VARAFLTPASSSLVVNVVPKEDFANAIGWITSSWQLASIFGPVAGGLLYGISGPAAYGFAALTFLTAAILIFSIPKPQQALETSATSLATLTGGFRYIWKQKIVLGAISLVIGYLTTFPIKNHAGVILFVTVALFGLATAVFGVSTSAWLSILALIAIGAFDMISVYIREILLQLWTPDKVRGRVNAVNSIFLGASNELGEFRAGFMAAAYGAVFTVTAGGVAAMGVSAIWAKAFPQLRNTQRLDAPDDV